MRDLSENDLLSIELRRRVTPEELEELIRVYREQRDVPTMQEEIDRLAGELAAMEDELAEAKG